MLHPVDLEHGGCIQVAKHIDEHRALNFASAFYMGAVEDVNPAMILRFDVR